MTTNKLSDLPWSRMGVEAVIIVASILLALGVDEWRQDREDRQLEDVYLNRLIEDLSTNLNMVVRHEQSDAAKVANARRIYPLVSRGEWQDLSPEMAVFSSYNASPADTPDWVNDAFEELKSTGRLGLITNVDIRRSILEYYRFLETNDWAYQLMSNEYRNAIRARMNPDLQLAIRELCVAQRVNCKASLDGFEYDEYLNWLTANRELADGLTRVIVQWTRGGQGYLPIVRSRTIDLKQKLETELGSLVE
jgi:hypothetical protein